MKNLSASLIALVAFVVLASVPALADTWTEPINTPDRFIVLESYNNQAVLDRETGLVWEQSHDPNLRPWLNAQGLCLAKTVGNRKGWRLPTVQELASLVDPSVPSPGPTLPADHPFSGVQSAIYWSATNSAGNPCCAWFVSFEDGHIANVPRGDGHFVWCVRGGQGVDPQ